MKFNYYYLNLINPFFWIKLFGIAIIYRGRIGLENKVINKIRKDVKMLENGK